MRQWERAKAQHPDTLLFFRMGDFYEMFGEDAKIVARECEITLTARHKDSENPIPMCGVPYHSVERHIVTLLSRGYRIAVCDQVEDPKYARGLVKREVVRVLSPGTVMEDAFLSGVGASTGNNYLAALSVDAKMTRFGLALVDISTGEFLSGEIEGQLSGGEPCETDDSTKNEGKVSGDEEGEDVTPDRAENLFRFSKLREELLRFSPAEVLVPQKMRECPGFLQMLADLRLRTTAFDASGFDSPREKLLSHFKTMSLRGFGLEEFPLAQSAASLALDYLRESHLGALGHLRRITLLSTDGWMILDNATRRNLELAQSIRDGSQKGTLLELLDETKTGAGSRLLRKWILQPLLSKERIERRLDAVSELRDNLLLRRDCRDLLKGIGDIERLVSRAVSGTGNARDLVSLQGALQTLPALQLALEKSSAPALTHVSGHLSPAPDLLELLQRALAEEPPALLTDGGLIKDGFDKGLDELRIISREGKGWIVALEEAERARTGIPSLKVGFNNVFGYFIEITKTNLAKVPADYTRKQTTANGERFITPDLKEKEETILGAQDKIKELERRLFENVRAQVVTYSGPLLDTARALAHLDVYASLSEVASRRDYVRPEILEEPSLDIRSGRHPIVEAAMQTPFVPNDCVLDTHEQQEIIITGPNASGKSTFLRQVALITLLAQIGSFVPARAAKIGIVDRIFTRVGAQDDLATGQSTFTVEMNETANILNNATPRSLVILDEVGRGTSTYDGLSIAWAVAEYLHELGPKTLFATHYHHLNELEERLPRVKNYRIAVKEDGDHIIFLRRIIRGGTDRSFGIQVARLAGLPTSVINRSKELLDAFSQEKLRGQNVETELIPAAKPLQNGSLFEEARSENPALEALRQLEIQEMTPVQAMIQLEQLQKMARKP
ncbi:DNA mismatch repair protein MutS [Abditibacterium utsteinense]|uniref:DNA mismatch repair protein MutS n=2 Tax=Abditibacterium utsteinense TaxID=1960156 RepID=A0A2S8SQ06_9BACT|nr:DNA mismatch repair protein MutS [Abditibacterium utsteinense]